MRDAALFLVLLAVGASVGVALTAPPRDAPTSTDEPAAHAGALRITPFAPFAFPKRSAPAHAVHQNGTLSTHAVVCTSGMSACEGFGTEKQEVPLGSGDDFGAFDINVSWSPTNPLTQRLEVAIRACLDVCRGGEPVLASASGSSPLRLHDELPFT